MATAPLVRGTDPVTYPTSDGHPMADNTKQFRWITTIQGGLDALFRDDPQVFVAGDLLWYAVEGEPSKCRAPDVLVVFGRPKGDRGAYLQWEEAGIAPQVVFEVRSPSNTAEELTKKFRFYEQYAVEEYYLYDPEANTLDGWQRQGAQLRGIAPMQGWVSPRLGIRFELDADGLQLYRPDGQAFVSYVELERQREQERQRAEEERQRAAEERQRAEEERQRADRLAAYLRSIGIDPDHLPEA